MTRPDLRCAAFLAIALTAAGCASAPPAQNFGLGEPGGSAARLRVPVRQILIAEPGAMQPLDGDAMIVFAAGRYEMIAGGRWSERLTRLVQDRIVRGFEDRGLAVGRTGTGLNGDFVVGADLKRFELVVEDGVSARVELTLRVIDAVSGRIVAARAFRADAPASSAAPAEAAAAFDHALDALLPQLTGWVLSVAR